MCGRLLLRSLEIDPTTTWKLNRKTKITQNSFHSLHKIIQTQTKTIIVSVKSRNLSKLKIVKGDSNLEKNPIYRQLVKPTILDHPFQGEAVHGGGKPCYF